jgi:membrane protein DedA with SNARE-associated domain
VLDYVLGLFSSYGYFVIVAGVLLENAGIPAPGHTVVLAGAFLAYQGRLSIVWVAVAACAAAIVGDNIGYWIGHHYGHAVVERHARLRKREPKVRRFFDQHGAKTVVIGRFIAGLQTMVALMAGVTRMPWRKFVFWNVLGAIAWAAAVSGVGYAAGSSARLIDHYLGLAGLIVLGIVVLVAGVLLWRSHRSDSGATPPWPRPPSTDRPPPDRATAADSSRGTPAHHPA